jgi:hypothetical protein
MKIGEPLKEYIVEPLENPVPVETPVDAPQKTEPVPVEPDKELTCVRS